MSDERIFGFDLARDGDVSGAFVATRDAAGTLRVVAELSKLLEFFDSPAGRAALENYMREQFERTHFGQVVKASIASARKMRRLREEMERAEGGDVMDTEVERKLEAGAQRLSLESSACRLSDDERARLRGGYWDGYPVGERDEPELFYPREGGRVYTQTLHTDAGHAPREVVTHVEPTTVYIPVPPDELLDSRFQTCPRCGASKFIGEVCQFCLDAGRVMLRDVGEVGFEAGGLRGRGRLLIGDVVDDGATCARVVDRAAADAPGEVETSPQAEGGPETAITEAGQGMSAQARAACEIADELRRTGGVKGGLLLRVRIGTTWAVSCDDLTFWPVKDRPKLSNADAMRAEVRRMAASDAFMPYLHDHINADAIEVICAR